MNGDSGGGRFKYIYLYINTLLYPAHSIRDGGGGHLACIYYARTTVKSAAAPPPDHWTGRPDGINRSREEPARWRVHAHTPDRGGGRTRCSRGPCSSSALFRTHGALSRRFSSAPRLLTRRQTVPSAVQRKSVTSAAATGHPALSPRVLYTEPHRAISPFNWFPFSG